jgi:hypothetical protein
MFDINREIVVKIPSPDGYKSARVRFPSDIDWVERMAKQRIVIRSLGRSASETEVWNAEEADAELFRRIRLSEDGAEFDQAEASAVIERLSRVQAGEAEREGSTFRIPLSVPGCDTVHFLRMPSQKQVNGYRKSAVRVIDGRHGRQELKVSLGPSAELYDALMAQPPTEDGTGAQAYDGDHIPIIHKAAVVAELLEALRAEEEDLGNV